MENMKRINGRWMDSSAGGLRRWVEDGQSPDGRTVRSYFSGPWVDAQGMSPEGDICVCGADNGPNGEHRMGFSCFHCGSS